jgi:hypothetical protein
LNNNGQIGNGTISLNDCSCQSTPVQSSVGAGNTEISAGWFHALTLKPVIPVAGFAKVAPGRCR